jgi:archaellum component FlaF (FlaF/FlaG flagellin family)
MLDARTAMGFSLSLKAVLLGAAWGAAVAMVYEAMMQTP